MTGIKIALQRAMRLEGAIGAAVVDFVSRMPLGTAGDPHGLDLDLAAHGDTDVVRAKLATLHLIGYTPERVEDILITLDTEYHLIRLLTRRPHEGLFFYLVLERGRADLDTVRKELHQIEDLL
ncbi:hypothetical protein [Streptomyces sp. NBC_00996]|uniref:hypothetical protein n=1 Tax=Streptomyces sp. NBC_00996 TaxID=2903710 RepID=UPI003864342A|nr:hypothetical protein OG390_43960 [Streptomyces sp. NBC_00996]